MKRRLAGFISLFIAAVMIFLCAGQAGVYAAPSQSGTNAYFSFYEGEQEYTVPEYGMYHITLAGAQGGGKMFTNPNTGHIHESGVVSSAFVSGGSGGIVELDIILNKGEKLYIHTGGAGTSSTDGDAPGGYNGGGSGSNGSGSGGGMTSVSFASAENTPDLINSGQKDKIIAVAGGGGGAPSRQFTSTLGTVFAYSEPGLSLSDADPNEIYSVIYVPGNGGSNDFSGSGAAFLSTCFVGETPDPGYVYTKVYGNFVSKRFYNIFARWTGLAYGVFDQLQKPVYNILRDSGYSIGSPNDLITPGSITDGYVRYTDGQAQYGYGQNGANGSGGSGAGYNGGYAGVYYFQAGSGGAGYVTPGSSVFPGSSVKYNENITGASANGYVSISYKGAVSVHMKAYIGKSGEGADISGVSVSTDETGNRYFECTENYGATVVVDGFSFNGTYKKLIGFKTHPPKNRMFPYSEENRNVEIKLNNMDDLSIEIRDGTPYLTLVVDAVYQGDFFITVSNAGNDNLNDTNVKIQAHQSDDTNKYFVYYFKSDEDPEYQYANFKELMSKKTNSSRVVNMSAGQSSYIAGSNTGIETDVYGSALYYIEAASAQSGQSSNRGNYLSACLGLGVNGYIEAIQGDKFSYTVGGAGGNAATYSYKDDAFAGSNGYNSRVGGFGAGDGQAYGGYGGWTEAWLNSGKFLEITGGVPHNPWYFGGGSHGTANINLLSYNSVTGYTGGNGYLRIYFCGSTGITEPEYVTKVHDYKAPNPVSDGEILSQDFSDITISWKNNGDIGTIYSFYAESHDIDMGTVLTSDVETLEVKSGVKEYYYIVDQKEDTVVTVENSTVAGSTSATIKRPETLSYIHIAAMDHAGNLSETYTYMIESAHLAVDPNGGFWSKDWAPDLADSAKQTDPSYTGIVIMDIYPSLVVGIATPVRNGFTFMGWDITDMDTGTHYYMQSASGSGTETSTAQKLSYMSVGPQYRYFKDLRVKTGTAVMKAVWMDNSAPAFDNMLTNANIDSVSDRTAFADDYKKGTRSGILSTRSYLSGNSGSYDNADERLALYTQASPFTIKRQLGHVVLTDDLQKGKPAGKNEIVYDSVTYRYDYRHNTDSAYASEFTGQAYNGHYPFIYGKTEDGSIYYPGTWTNKSVVLTVNILDGLGNKNETAAGGSGIKYVRFDKYKRTYEGNTKECADEQVDGSDITGTVSKVFSRSGVYQVSVTAQDNAGSANNAERGGWIANPSGDFTLKKSYGYTASGAMDMTSAILIDKDAPVLFDPESYLSTGEDHTLVSSVFGAMDYKKAKAVMYEGYNEVSDPADGDDAYGWSMDYVRIVVYADDGEGSGIAADDPAFCWIPDGSGIDYKDASKWQGSDSERILNGKTYKVSTRVVDRNESGKVYVRDAVGNWSCLEYNADHIDREAPEVTPDPDPEDPDDPDPDDPDNPGGEDPEDPELKSYTDRGMLYYDWVNHDVRIRVNAEDLAAVGNGHMNSDIYRMNLYHSDSEFTKVKDGRGRDRAKGYIDEMDAGASFVTGDVLFKTSKFSRVLSYIEGREGINYYILEVIDKAGNMTSLDIAVKIDKTHPGIPRKPNESETEELKGNELLSNFGGSSHWMIHPLDLNEFSADEIEADIINNEEMMRCDFYFHIHDNNFTGNYAHDAVREAADAGYRAIDDSGYASVEITLSDTDDDSVSKTYLLYDYEKGLDASLYRQEHLAVNGFTDTVFTNEYSVPLFRGTPDPSYQTWEPLNGQPLNEIGIYAGINTLLEFPYAALLDYEIKITDRAGNIRTYKNAPGNEIRNFSIKAVLYSAEDEEFNIPFDEYKTTGMQNANKGISVPYYQLGDVGYAKIWTVGYVSGVQFDFDREYNTRQETIGTEMISEIRNGRVPEKYNLGVLSDTEFERILPYTAGQEIRTSYSAPARDGIPFASVYGTVESTLGESQTGWKDTGSSVRIPIDRNYGSGGSGFLKPESEGKKQEDNRPEYEDEAHAADFHARKYNKAGDVYHGISTAPYVIYDTRQNDIHYRITHES